MQQTILQVVPEPQAQRSVLGWLVAQSGNQAGKVIALRNGCIVGSDRSCDLVLDDPSVAPRHARLVLTPSGWAIEDFGGQTMINQARLSRGPLAHLLDKDLVRLGRVVLVFKCL